MKQLRRGRMSARPLEDLSQLVLAAKLPQETIRATLAAYHFQRTEWTDEILQELAGEPGLRELFAQILPAIFEALKDSADPEMGLLNFARFAESAISKATFFRTLQNDPILIEVAASLFSTSQFFSDILIRDIRHFDWLREAYSSGTLEDRERMLAELRAEVNFLQTEENRLAALRRFKRKEMLRIGFADIVREARLESVTADLSNLADAALQVALEMCLARLKVEIGTPRGPDGEESELAVLAVGKLGGRELNYSSDIDLIFVYSESGQVEPSPQTGARALTNQEFFDKLANEIVRSISQATENGFVFRVDTRLRPNGLSGPLTRSLGSCGTYYTSEARLWEFQALIKARCAAGSPRVGQKFLQMLEPLIYHKYLTFEEIHEIRDLKRQIEQKASRSGVTDTGVKIGRGGIRDIEFTVQFQQLVLGGQHAEVRTGNTLEALRKLSQIGALSHEEALSLESAYRFLRKTEHRLMTLHQFKSHALPARESELNRLAVRMGFREMNGEAPAQVFEREYRRHTRTVRRIFGRAFGKLVGSTTELDQARFDLVFSPETGPEEVEAALAPLGFDNVPGAYECLQHLSEEDTPLLQSPRTRQHLAGIAPLLLEEIAHTPQPDRTLLQFDRVVTSLGAKTMLYHWLSEQPEAMELLLRICSVGQFLANILGTSPGMFDELVDSLAINARETEDDLTRKLADLLAGAEEAPAILNGFQSAELLRIGAQDLLGRSQILETFEDLSRLAGAILRGVIDLSQEKLSHRFGLPENSRGEEIPFCVLAMGKFGGQELNYFSDLDVIYAYGENGKTGQGMPAAEYFTRLAQAIARLLNEPTQYGRLYEIDARLRPAGSKGPLACSADFLESYYAGKQARTWERQALTKVRAVAGDLQLGAELVERLHAWVYRKGLGEAELADICAMRAKLEESAEADSFKRGPGGIVDIEFILQILRLQHGWKHPQLRSTNEMIVLDAVEELGLLPPEICPVLREAYHFLRKLENRLRMVTNRSTDVLPGDAKEMHELAISLGYGLEEGDRLRADCERMRHKVRTLFDRIASE